MVWQRDVDLVVPLWQGGDDVRVAAGAAALARLVPARGSRLHVAVSDGRLAAADGVANLDLVDQALRQLRSRLAKRDPHRVLTLGGDGTCDLAAIEHLAHRHPGMTVYWLDAHACLHTPHTSTTGRANGMALRLLLGEGHARLLGATRLVPAQVVLVGTRAVDHAEATHAQATRLAAVEPVGMIADAATVVAHQPRATAAYVHLDLDVCDPMDLAAVAHPEPLGPRAASVAAALRTIAAHHDVVGVGVCEYTPSLEHDPAVVRALLDALGLTARPGAETPR